MNPIIQFLIIITTFSAGFAFGAWWVVAHKDSRQDYEIDNHMTTRRCDRCGQLFDIDMTDDPGNRVCHHCMEELRNNPKDPYWEVMANQ